MPMYEGFADVAIRYTVMAEDEAQAREFIKEAATEEFPDGSNIDCYKVKEIK